MTDTPKAKNPRKGGRTPGINEQQRQFAEHYAATGSCVEAARLAGYSTPRSQGPRLLRHPGVMELLKPIFEAKAEESNGRIATAAQRHEFWTRVMLGLEEGVEMKDRLKASELLGKCQGDFVERKEITGKDGAPLQVNHSVESAKGWLTDILSDLNGSAKE
jgi:phage terminase small subunit